MFWDNFLLFCDILYKDLFFVTYIFERCLFKTLFLISILRKEYSKMVIGFSMFNLDFIYIVVCIYSFLNCKNFGAK